MSVKALSADTSLEAQSFMISRLREMSPSRRLEITQTAISAGLKVHHPNSQGMNPFEVAHRVTQFLEAQGIEYFLGGSIASTVYGEPRFTQHVDIILRLTPWKVSKLVGEFEGEFYLSLPALQEAASRATIANLIHLETNFKIDLMFSGDTPFEISAFERKVKHQVTGLEFYFCTAEDIILAKLDWYRKSGRALDRQLRDIQTVMMVQRGLDLEYLRAWAKRQGTLAQLENSLRDAGVE